MKCRRTSIQMHRDTPTQSWKREKRRSRRRTRSARLLLAVEKEKKREKKEAHPLWGGRKENDGRKEEVLQREQNPHKISPVCSHQEMAGIQKFSFSPFILSVVLLYERQKQDAVYVHLKSYHDYLSHCTNRVILKPTRHSAASYITKSILSHHSFLYILVFYFFFFPSTVPLFITHSIHLLERDTRRNTRSIPHTNAFIRTHIYIGGKSEKKDDQMDTLEKCS